MRPWNVIVGLAGACLMLAAALITYYAISYAVLYAVGKLFPLTGRKSSRSSRTT